MQFSLMFSPLRLSGTPEKGVWRGLKVKSYT